MTSDPAHDAISWANITHGTDEDPTKRPPAMEGTPQDQEDMTRMGKIQELKVLYYPIWCDMEALS